MAQPNIQELRQLIDFTLAQKWPHWGKTRVLFGGKDAARHIGAVFEHGGKLQDMKMFVLEANAFLFVKDITLSRKLKPNEDRNEDRAQNQQANGAQ